MPLKQNFLLEHTVYGKVGDFEANRMNIKFASSGSSNGRSKSTAAVASLLRGLNAGFVGIRAGLGTSRSYRLNEGFLETPVENNLTLYIATGRC